MKVSELREAMEELPGDLAVKVIMDGVIDDTPSWNVDDDCIYIEGVSPERDIQ